MPMMWHVPMPIHAEGTAWCRVNLAEGAMLLVCTSDSGAMWAHPDLNFWGVQTARRSLASRTAVCFI